MIRYGQGPVSWSVWQEPPLSAAGLLGTEKNFRRIRGYSVMGKLLHALDQRNVAESSRAA